MDEVAGTWRDVVVRKSWPASLGDEGRILRMEMEV